MGGYDPSVVPSAEAPQRGIFRIDNFKGADLSSNEVDMDPGRSPSCPNMIRATPGKVRKRMGYKHMRTLSGKINGAWIYDHKEFIHAGTKLYVEGEIIAGSETAATTAYNNSTTPTDTGLADVKSSGAVIDDKLIIYDGSCAWIVTTKPINTNTIYYAEPLADNAYVPTLMISKNPDGTGGEFYDEINCLSDAWTEKFCVTTETATATVFSLSLNSLSNKLVTAQKMESDGVTWTDLTEGQHFSVDRTTGKITFTTAPGKSPVDGADNISITAYKDRTEQRSRIYKSTLCAVYPVSATGARLFCSGNSEHPNIDYWSAINDPTYFPDVNFSRLGRADSYITGYSVFDNAIAAHKDANEDAIYVRTPITDEDGYQQFAITNMIKGPGAIAPHSFAYLSQEPLFLTNVGIYALTVNDLTQVRYTQDRSFFLNGALLKEDGLTDVYACVFKDYYVLAAGDRLYILDSTTREYTRNEPYSTHQYEAFYFTGIKARVVWVNDDTLYFGTETGDVYAFKKNTSSPLSYNDDGNTIPAHWQTAAIQGGSFYHYKHLTRCAIQLEPFSRTSISVNAKKNGTWVTLFTNTSTVGYFDFDSLDFNNLSFKPCIGSRTINRKISIRKIDKAQIRLYNDDTPFGLESVAIEYNEYGYYKGL